MANWSQLPPEIKRHIARKLDFMSRHAMKLTSYLDRLIVNSTNFKLPRVRFGYKGDRCLIVIYTGIEKFLRLEMIKETHGITVLRSENSWDPKAISSKHLPPTSDLLELGLHFLKSLLTDKSILIRVMELEIVKDEKNFKNRINAVMGGAKFRINEIAMSTPNYTIINEFFHALATRKDLKRVRYFDVNVCAVNFGFQSVAESIMLQYYGFPELTYYRTIFNMIPVTRDAQFLTNSLLHDFVDEGIKHNKISLAAEHILSPHTDAILPTVRKEDYLAIRKHTKCGYSNFLMETKNEQVLENYMNLSCGLGNYCKDCGDPFEYWYYQNLPRRILHEPFWTDFILDLFGSTENVLRGKFRADEKKKEQIFKNQKSLKNSKSSWGFREISVEKLMEKMRNLQENKAKNKKKNRRKLAVKVPEILDSRDFQKSEDVENSPENPPEFVINNPETLKKFEDIGIVPEDASEHSGYETVSEDTSDDVKNSENAKTLPLFVYLVFPILGAFVFYWIVKIFAFL
ncbi:hypothetical protein B9Z55_021465 [Caenorhabditis nigoni]|nr:hypothetical protein B9Z55_021465 [Caenorhabditis nigoni]